MEINMKILYNRFVKAIAMLLLLVTAVITIGGIGGMYYTYSNDSVKNKENPDFNKTRLAKSLVENSSFRLYRYIRDEMDQYMVGYYDDDGVYRYYNETVDATYYDDAGNTDDDNYNSENETTAYDNENTDVSSNAHNMTDGSHSIDEEYDNAIEKVSKETSYLQVVNDLMSDEYVNYKYKMYYNDKIIISNVNDDDIVKISTTTLTVGDRKYITIENYLNKNLEKGDVIYKKYQVFDIITKNYNVIKYATIISGILAVILCMYIMVVAGYNGQGELELNWIDTIPLEIIIFIAFLVQYMTAFIISESGTYELGRMMDGIFFIAIGSVWYIFTINIFISILSRLKNKVLFKNSITSKIIKFIIKCVKNVVVNLDKKWKAIITIGGCFFWECVLFIINISAQSMIIWFIWFIFKIVEFFLLMYAFSLLLELRDRIKSVHDGNTENSALNKPMPGLFGESNEYITDISAGLEKAVAEKVKSEQLKAELITNVSHDIKTPLTSIINYIDLMNKEDIQNEKVREYIGVAYKQSLRLKKLTEDIVEASKASTGNIEVKSDKINICEIISQSVGEYTDKFEQLNITVVFDESDKGYEAMADGRLLWRVIENLFTNICKYALEGTRLYIDVSQEEKYVKIYIKNISKYKLNIPGDELMERFVRGDLSRSTSGNGLGLSIAKSLVELQKGYFDIDINGDLFTAIITLPRE